MAFATRQNWRNSKGSALSAPWAAVETVLCAAATGLARLFPHADDTLSVYAFCLPHAALGASMSAKVAEKAAEAALADPRQSGNVAREAVRFALDAIWTADQPGLVEVVEADFVAAGESDPKRPWWRFWGNH